MKDISSYICLNNKVSIVSIVRGADCAAAVTAACCCSQLLHADQTPPPSPPAAALQDRKTRAAENHISGVRLVTGVATHSAAAGFTLPPPCSRSGSRCGHWLAAVHQLPQSLAQGFRRERTRRPPATGLRGRNPAPPILFKKAMNLILQ